MFWKENERQPRFFCGLITLLIVKIVLLRIILSLLEELWSIISTHPIATRHSHLISSRLIPMHSRPFPSYLISSDPNASRPFPSYLTSPHLFPFHPIQFHPIRVNVTQKEVIRNLVENASYPHLQNWERKKDRWMTQTDSRTLPSHWNNLVQHGRIWANNTSQKVTTNNKWRKNCAETRRDSTNDL